MRQNNAARKSFFGSDLDPKAERWLISCDPIEQKFGGTRALNWRRALEELFGG